MFEREKKPYRQPEKNVKERERERGLRKRQMGIPIEKEREIEIAIEGVNGEKEHKDY